MARILHASCTRAGIITGSVKVCLDGQEACFLRKNSMDLEITESAHTVTCKVLGRIPVFAGTIPEGSTNWTLSYCKDSFFGKFNLHESEPVYGQNL